MAIFVHIVSTGLFLLFDLFEVFAYDGLGDYIHNKIGLNGGTTKLQ